MKTIQKTLLLILLLSCLYCQAQEEAISMLDGNPIWIYYRYCFGGTDPFEKNQYTVFSVKGDTVVNNKRYVKLYVDSYMYKGITVNDYYGDDHYDVGLYALLREEDDRIYAETSFFEKRYRKYYKAFLIVRKEPPGGDLIEAAMITQCCRHSALQAPNLPKPADHCPF